MEDSTSPLLSSRSESSKPLASLDSTIERCIGGFAWTQFLQAILVSIAWLFDAQQTFISVVTDANPTWHCNNSSTITCNTASSNICQLPSNSWSWDLPPQISIISEWSLQCSSSFLTGLPASSFFMGCLVGGLLLATLADSSLGRKNMLFYSCSIMSLSSLLTALFSTNIWIYSILRFVGGFGRATIGTCALVLSTELVGKRWRGQVAVIGFLFFTLGFLSLPAMAYINRGSSWRNLYIWSSIPSLIYCILVKLFVGESPRWLFVRGRREEAVSILMSISKIDNNIGTSITMSFFGNVELEEESWNVDIYSALKILFENKWAFRRLCLVMVIGFGVGMVYYGMPLALGNMSFNLYLSVTFNALSELPSSLITLFLIDKMKRRSSLVGFTSLSAICSVLSVIVGNGMNWTSFQLGLELVSFFSACTAFNITLIYTLELFPTCVRNSAVSMVRQALVLGGVFSPVLAAAGRKNGFWSYGIFGLMIGFCGFFVVFLPETKGARFCDTMDEEEHKTVVNDHDNNIVA